jgi:hypothetical protein
MTSSIIRLSKREREEKRREKKRREDTCLTLSLCLSSVSVVNVFRLKIEQKKKRESAVERSCEE